VKWIYQKGGFENMDELQKRANDLIVAEGCCGGPALHEVDACCAADAEAKESGEEGCGCNSSTSGSAKKSTSCCD
jgi:hypothetical protein